MNNLWRQQKITWTSGGYMNHKRGNKRGSACKSLFLSAVFLWSALLSSNSASGSAGSPRDSAAVIQVVFKIQSHNDARDRLQNAQSALQGITGVPYVGVDYLSSEVTVRFLAPQVTTEKLLTLLAGDQSYQISIVADAKVVGAMDSLGVMPAQNQLKSIKSTMALECLRHEDAQLLCDMYLKGKLHAGIALEDCYVIRIDFQSVMQEDGNYDWLSLARLVDGGGKLIRPLSWHELPARRDKPFDTGTSGLLIFPRLPGLRLGLVLRLLRENGDGYDSFTVPVPEIN